MARKLSEQVGSLLTPFKSAIGESFDKVVLDLSSWLGRQAITVDEGQWKTGAGLKLTAKDNHKMQLPPNDPRSVLVWFALRCNEVSAAGEFTIEATLPKQCVAWIEKENASVPA